VATDKKEKAAPTPKAFCLARVSTGMAGIATSGGPRGRRALDHALPLVPFIDFMICLIAFLMVTAVWTQMSRINATGKAPGEAIGSPREPHKELHVVATTAGFDLRWQQGALVLETQHVPRKEQKTGDDLRFPALSDAISREWSAQGQHRAETDHALDRAVLHVPNNLPFSEIVAILDALHAPRRAGHSAFDVAFASN
jgi:biopolymer transport protein ExbD